MQPARGLDAEVLRTRVARPHRDVGGRAFPPPEMSAEESLRKTVWWRRATTEMVQQLRRRSMRAGQVSGEARPKHRPARYLARVDSHRALTVDPLSARPPVWLGWVGEVVAGARWRRPSWQKVDRSAQCAIQLDRYWPVLLYSIGDGCSTVTPRPAPTF